MREGYLYVLALEMTDGIEGIVVHAVVEQVGKTIARVYSPSVEHDGKTGVQIGVVAQHGFYKLVSEFIVLEESRVGLKVDVSTVLVLSVLGDIANEHTLFENRFPYLAITIGICLEMVAQGIYRLQAHTIQTYALLEGFRVILTTSVKHRNGFHEFALRDTSTIVANAGTQIVLYVHLDALAGIHLKFVDAIVYHLFQ